MKSNRRFRAFSLVALVASFLTLLVGTGAATSLASEALTLAEGGRTDYVIVLPKNPTPVQTTAARELASALKNISGAEFPTVSETEVAPSPEEKLLVIGPSAASRELLGDAIDESRLEYDAIVIRQAGNAVVFSGHPVRGMLYAVNTFLEDALGCRWWTAGESYIPKRDRVNVSDFDTLYAPKVICREPYYSGITGKKNVPFAVRLKCNGASEPIPEEYGGHHGYVFFVHSFYRLIPATEYEAHPEWFPEIDGVRKVGYPDWAAIPKPCREMFQRLKPEQFHPAGTQLCLSNEEVFRVMLERALAEIAKHQKATIVSISQNDWRGDCQCAECRRTAEEEGSPAGPYIRFVNRMAEEIEKVYPGLYVDTLAYKFSRTPPKLTRARDNVIVRLCLIECSYNEPIGGGKRNESIRSDFEGWSRMADRLFVWDYCTNFSLYLLPFPNWRVLGDNIRFFAEHNAAGIFEQGDNGTPTGDFVQLRAWVIAKLLWNPDLDQRELMKEFIAGYYAPELVPIFLDYFDLLCDRFESTGEGLGIYNSAARDWLDLETLRKATALYDLAEKIAADLETHQPVKYSGLRMKVRRERIPIDLVWLMGYPQYRQEARLTRTADLPSLSEMKGLLDNFFARLDRFQIKRHSEGASPEWFAEFKEELALPYSLPVPPRPASAPDLCRSLAPDRWLDLQTIDFSLEEPGERTFIEEDPQASDGEAVRIPSAGGDKAIAYGTTIFANIPPDKIGTPRVYAFVRAETADGSPLPREPLFRMGVYNDDEEEETVERVIAGDDLKESGYTMIDLGEISADPELSFRLAPIERAEPTVNIYLDRVVITL